MNERIRDLLIKSGFATGYDRHHRGHWILSDTEAEKFAELIVRECLSYAEEGDLDFMKFMIKKHFGVEE